MIATAGLARGFLARRRPFFDTRLEAKGWLGLVSKGGPGRGGVRRRLEKAVARRLERRDALERSKWARWVAGPRDPAAATGGRVRGSGWSFGRGGARWRSGAGPRATGSPGARGEPDQVSTVARGPWRRASACSWQSRRAAGRPPSRGAGSRAASRRGVARSDGQRRTLLW